MKKLIKSVVFVLVFILGLYGLYQIFRWKDTSGDYMSSTESFYALKGDKVDVLFVGPSFTYCLANPAQLWDDCGISAFTLAISGQDKEAEYYTIKEALKTQTPDVVMVDYSCIAYNGYLVDSNLYRNALSPKLSKNNWDFINSLDADLNEKKDYLLRWPIVHTRYKELKQYDFVQNMASLYTLGFQYSFNTFAWPDNYTLDTTDNETPISEENKAYIDRIMKLAEEEGFSVVFYMPAVYYKEEILDSMNGVDKYLNEVGAKYINFFHLVDEIGISTQTDYVDYGHTNVHGGEKLVKYMERYLADNFELYDHRGEVGYEAWEAASKYRSHIMTERVLSQTSDPETVSNLLVNLEDTVQVISFEGFYQMSSFDLASVYDAFQLSGASYEDGGTWILQDGEQTNYLAPDSDEVVHILVNSQEYITVLRDTTETDKITISVNYGSTPMNPPQDVSGLYLMVYDSILERIIYNGWIY